MKKTLAILAYSIFLEICVHLITYNQFRLYDNWLHEIINHLGNILPLFLITSALVYVIFSLTDRGIMARKFLPKIIVDTTLSIGITIGIFALMLWCYGSFTSSIDIHYGSILAINFITLLMLEMLYYMSKRKIAERQAEQSKALAIQYQYDAFRAQVNPHFLFNSLNILIEIIHQNPQKAEEFTESLADIYHHVLRTHRSEKTPVADELAFLDSYIHILSIKYGNSLQVEVKREQASQQRQLVPFTMQILMENVSKHNIISEKQPMTVSILIGQDGITFCNRIQRKILKQQKQAGVGLKYLATQYSTFNKELIIEDNGTEFRVKAPYL